MTKDLALVIHGKNLERSHYNTLDQFIAGVKDTMDHMAKS